MSVRETAERIRALSDSERVGTITTDYVYLGEGEGEMPMDCIDWTIPTDDLKELAQAWLDANEGRVNRKYTLEDSAVHITTIPCVILIYK